MLAAHMGVGIVVLYYRSSVLLFVLICCHLLLEELLQTLRRVFAVAIIRIATQAC